MPPRIWALGAGGAAIVGAAVAGGYFVGHLNNPKPPQAVQTQSPPEQPAQPYPQESEPSASEQQAQSNYATGYSRSVYSPWRNGSYQRAPRHRTHRVSFQYFRDSLSPYGHWMHSDRWGEVWQPTDVEADFRPYERGHWTDTREFGWTWVSDYEWGDVPFHYGRWVDDPERGWLWVPGYVWGPGWVVWRSGSHHTGWMPMPPDRHFLRGEEEVRIDWSRERDDYGYRDWYGPYYDQDRLDSHWVYVDTGHFADPDYRRYEVRRPEQIHQLSIETHNATNYVTVDNFIVNRSIDPRVVERQSGRAVNVVPATKVIAKPELVVPVNTGTQIAVTTHQDIPAGTGEPHSAPPANPLALNAPPPAANAPLPPLPPKAPSSVIATQGSASVAVKPEQKPNGTAAANGSVTTAPPSSPTSARPTANSVSPQPQAQQPGTPNGAPMAEHRHRGAPWWSQQGQPQGTTVGPNAPSNRPASTANAQPSSPQVLTQPFAPNGERAAKHRHGIPPWAQQGAPPEAGQNPQTNAPASTAATTQGASPRQQAQPLPSSSESRTGSNDERMFERPGHHGRRRPEPGAEASGPASGEQSGGSSQAGATAAQQPSVPQEQEREAKHHEKKGEVVPSSLPPGSPSPYAQSPNAQSNANGEAQSRDQSKGEPKHRKHRGRNENPDTSESPAPQQQ